MTKNMATALVLTDEAREHWRYSERNRRKHGDAGCVCPLCGLLAANRAAFDLDGHYHSWSEVPCAPGECRLRTVAAKSRYEVELFGCDDSTRIVLALTADQAKLIRMLAALSRRNSGYGCMPVLALCQVPA